MDETVTLAATPGIEGLVEPAVWKQTRDKLTVPEQQVYRYLRWIATAPSFGGRTTVAAMARGIGDTVHGSIWGGTGTMTKAGFMRALEGLDRAGLVEIDEGEWE
jgi:hypothetical protein